MNFSGGQTADGEPKEEWIEDELGRLDMDLLRKSKQHNLTSNNVRAILHVSVSSLTYTHWRRCVRCVFVIPQEVITHEHVVSMMKAAIRDTQDQPMFVSPPPPAYCLLHVCEAVSLPTGTKNDSFQTETVWPLQSGEPPSTPTNNA